MDLLNYHDRKKKFMDARFGKFKSFVLRRLQIASMRKFIDHLINTNNDIVDQGGKIRLMCTLFDYMYTARDNWQFSAPVNSALKKKLMEFSTDHPLVFRKYLTLFGFACPYVKRDATICYRPGTLCKQHLHCQTRLQKRIDLVLSGMPTEVCGIITLYALPYCDNHAFVSMRK